MDKAVGLAPAGDRAASTDTGATAHEGAAQSAFPEAGGAYGRLLSRKIARRLARRAADANGVAPGAEHAVAQAEGSSGAPLPAGVQQRFEGALGADLSGVRVHTGPSSEKAAEAVGAQAYTSGTDIHFAAGKYDPGSSSGQHLLAHEVAHTVQQQGGGGATTQAKMEVSDPGDHAEVEADRAADAMVGGQAAHVAHGGGGVQRQKAPDDPGTAGATGTTTTGDAAEQALIKKLDLLRLDPLYGGIVDGGIDIGSVLTWLKHIVETLEAAKVAGGATPSPALVKAADEATAHAAIGVEMFTSEVRTDTIKLTNDSSVVKKDAVKAPKFPTKTEVTTFSGYGASLNRLSRDATFPAQATAKASLKDAAKTAQDAALALLQAASVISARDTWKKGSAVAEPTVAEVKDPKHATGEVDNIFGDSGFSGKASYYTTDGGGEAIFDWCGMFVVAGMYRGGGIDQELRAGFFHTDNVQDYFKYEQKHNAGRAPKSIYAEDTWWNMKGYHGERGSLRTWMPQATLAAAIEKGTAVDIRPGDVVLIDHTNNGSADHITMVESFNPTTLQMTTIEGNISGGIRANAAGGVDRMGADGKDADDGDYIKPGSSSRDGSGVNIRDLTTISSEATKKYPKDPKAPKDPKGSYSAQKGTTVFGVGRPSVVDFEEHEYAVNDVPAALKNKTPAEIRTLAAKKGVKGEEAKQQKGAVGADVMAPK